jgi:hypothetical protein
LQAALAANQLRETGIERNLTLTNTRLSEEIENGRVMDKLLQQETVDRKRLQDDVVFANEQRVAKRARRQTAKAAEEAKEAEEAKQAKEAKEAKEARRQRRQRRQMRQMRQRMMK